MSDALEPAAKRLMMISVTAVLVIVLIFGTLYTVNLGIREYTTYLSAKAVDRMSPAAHAQTAFTRPYMIWMTKYCIEKQRKRKFSTDQRLAYCSCFTEQQVTRLTMAEHSLGVSTNWNRMLIPEIQKKLDEFDLLCLQKALQ